jgi:hypothetical protein
MSECKKIRRLLALRPDDRSAAEQKRVEAHLDTCAECAALAETYAEQDRVLRDKPWVGLTPSQRGQLLSTIHRERRRYEMRNKLSAVLGAAASVAILIALAFGLKVLLPRSVRVAPGGISPGDRSESSSPPKGRTARLRGVDFAVVEHERTGCVMLGSGEERCPPEGQAYLWVKFYVENSERYPTTDNGPRITVVHQGQELPEMLFLPEGKSSRWACTPDGYYRDEPCHFWVGAVVPTSVDDADLAVQARWGETTATWPLGAEEEVRVLSEGQFQWPTSRREISGWRFHDPRNPEHTGIDIAADKGDPIVSVAAGEVTFAGEQGDDGNLVIVEHTDGWSSHYAQLDEITVDVGQRVTQGELLGKAGSTGNSSAPHLHFELHYKGYPADPLDHLPSQSDLRDLLLREEELPGTAPEGDDWEPETIRMDGEDWVRDIARSDGCLEALKVEGFRQMEEGEGGVYVWNGVYRFATAQQAREQYEELLTRDALASGEPLYERIADGGMEATTMAFTGSEGEAIYWLFGVEENTIHLLMVDSFGDEAAREVFNAAMSRVLRRP